MKLGLGDLFFNDVRRRRKFVSVEVFGEGATVSFRFGYRYRYRYGTVAGDCENSPEP
jgi:hypothetical protein